jgi:hypothetical protein
MRGRPFKYYRDESELPQEGYRVIEKHLDDEQHAKEDSPEEDFLFSDNNKEIPSPKKEQKKEQVRVESPVKSYRVEEQQPLVFNKPEKHLKELIEDKEHVSGNKGKFEDVVHVQSTSFHIPTKQPEKKEFINTTTNTGFTIGTSSGTPKYTQSTQTKTPTSSSTTKTTKKEEQQPIPQQQMPFYPFPYPMFFYPPNYDPNTQVPTPHTTTTPPMQPHPMMYYMPPQYMQQPEKVDTERKGFGGTFGGPAVII